MRLIIKKIGISSWVCLIRKMGPFYFVVRLLAKLSLPFYFGRIEINGRDNIPEDHPFIIAPNHQNAFLDAILMGVYMQKPVHFLTRSDVFIPPFLGVLSSLNMMPVYRIRDGYEKLSKNEEVFRICEVLLSRDLPVLIFPEGNMGEGHMLRPLTKGTSRLAFQSQDKIDKDLFILPVGINYFHHYQPWYKCIINFGQPLRVRDYAELLEQNKARALIKLKGDLYESLKGLMLIPEKDNYEENRKALNRHNEKFSFTQLKAKIDAGQFQHAHYYPNLKIFSDFLTLFNFPSVLIIRYLLENVVKDRQFTSSLKFTLGLVISILWWTMLFTVLLITTNLKFASIIVALSIFLLFLRSYIRKLSIPATP